MSRDFPAPPAAIEDAEGRQIDVLVATDATEWVEPLVAMYVRFDPEDRAQGIPPTGEPAITDWAERMLEEGVNLVAVHGERVVGHATLIPAPDGIRHELAIFVERAYQRAGIGRILLEHLLGHAADLGIERVWLTVERWNSPAIALYRSVGFEDLGSERFEREMELGLGDQTDSTG